MAPQRSIPSLFRREPSRGSAAWALVPLVFVIVAALRGGSPPAILGTLCVGLAATLCLATIAVILRERRRDMERGSTTPHRTARTPAPVRSAPPISDLSTVVAPEQKCPIPPGAELSDVLSRLRHDHATLATLQNVVLDFRMHGGLDRAPLDVPLLHFVLDRLVENALRHAPGGSIVEIRATPSRDGRIARIAIGDDGEPISDSVSSARDLVVARPTLASDSSVLRAHSFAECRRRLEHAGGSLVYEPRAPRGSRFLVELPIDSSFLSARRSVKSDESRSH